jgi:hypothetical protein
MRLILASKKLISSENGTPVWISLDFPPYRVVTEIAAQTRQISCSWRIRMVPLSSFLLAKLSIHFCLRNTHPLGPEVLQTSSQISDTGIYCVAAEPNPHSQVTIVE